MTVDSGQRGGQTQQMLIGRKTPNVDGKDRISYGVYMIACIRQWYILGYPWPAADSSHYTHHFWSNIISVGSVH